MRMNLPSNIQIKAVTYGTPRVGNDAYANYFDSKASQSFVPFTAQTFTNMISQVSDFVRVNNEKDIVPILPGRGLGYSHPQGEIHIRSPGSAVACQGNDNASDPECTIRTVPDIFVGDITDHLGPYEGISVGTASCV